MLSNVGSPLPGPLPLPGPPPLLLLPPGGPPPMGGPLPSEGGPPMGSPGENIKNRYRVSEDTGFFNFDETHLPFPVRGDPADLAARP